jgi:hypothetical protein
MQNDNFLNLPVWGLHLRQIRSSSLPPQSTTLPSASKWDVDNSRLAVPNRAQQGSAPLSVQLLWRSSAVSAFYLLPGLQVS